MHEGGRRAPMLTTRQWVRLTQARWWYAPDAVDVDHFACVIDFVHDPQVSQSQPPEPRAAELIAGDGIRVIDQRPYGAGQLLCTDQIVIS